MVSLFRIKCFIPFVVWAMAAVGAFAQTAPTDAPAAPVPPASVARDAQGRATVRAIPLDEPLRVDGQLDEAVYTRNQSVSDFLQQVPREGTPATERTEAWVTFDRDNLYIAARCWDTAPADRWVANELRRDTIQLRQNDTFGVILDTFYDRRNGYLFYTNHAEQVPRDLRRRALRLPGSGGVRHRAARWLFAHRRRCRRPYRPVHCRDRGVAYTGACGLAEADVTLTDAQQALASST